MNFMTTLVLLAYTTAVSAQDFYVNNWCTYPVYIWQSLDGGCDGGLVACTPGQNTNPWTVESGSTWSHSWTNGATSLKIGTITPSDNGLGKIGILQFEYKLVPASPHTPQVLYWDLSDLDGVGGGLVGSPFHHENVKATPYKNGTGLNGCHQIRCPHGKLCRAAYNTPNDVDTRGCAGDLGWPMTIDLCQSEPDFSNWFEFNYTAYR